MKKRPIIFDCDPGHDDAIALVMALACPDWDIRAITTVGGNNTIQNVTNNALRILEVTGRTEIPDKPLLSCGSWFKQANFMAAPVWMGIRCPPQPLHRSVRMPLG